MQKKQNGEEPLNTLDLIQDAFFNARVSDLQRIAAELLGDI